MYRQNVRVPTAGLSRTHTYMMNVTSGLDSKLSKLFMLLLANCNQPPETDKADQPSANTSAHTAAGAQSSACPLRTDYGASARASVGHNSLPNPVESLKSMLTLKMTSSQHTNESLGRPKRLHTTYNAARTQRNWPNRFRDR
jgi:hypothetical protein